MIAWERSCLSGEAWELEVFSVPELLRSEGTFSGDDAADCKGKVGLSQRKVWQALSGGSPKFSPVRLQSDR